MPIPRGAVLVEILIREYRPEDASRVLEAYRDSMQSLRASQGGIHPEWAVDMDISRPDEELLSGMTYRSILLVAEVKGTGEVAGIGGLGIGLLNRLAGCVYSKAHYVKRAFQRGKAGISVGSMLRKATISTASGMGFRKLYGYTTSESVSFHAKAGARLVPMFNRMHKERKVCLRYYEIELRRNILNALPIEPIIFAVMNFFYDIQDASRGKERERSKGG